jgi:hypothetical protein
MPKRRARKMTEENVEQQIYGNGTIWITTVSSWSGRDKLTAEDLGKSPDDILDIIELGRKKIIPEEVRIGLQRPNSQITSLMVSLGKRFFIRGAWYIPNNHFMLAKTGLDKIRDNQATIVEDLIDNLPEIKATMIEKYPMLVDATWPTEQQIRNRFSVNWHVCEIRGAEVTDADPEELAAAKLEFKDQLKKTYEEYRDQILEQAKVAIFDACNEISNKIETGQKITESTIKKPKKVIDDYLNIAQIFDLDEVKTAVVELRQKLEDINAQSLRDNWDFAQQFAETVRGMADTIGELSGLSSDGTVKRTVAFKKAA